MSVILSLIWADNKLMENSTRLLENSTRLFFCEIPRAMSQDTARRLFDTLPEYRRKKAESYRKNEDRLLSAGAWHVVRHGIDKVYGLDAFAEPISEDRYGKPSFPARSGMHFNISHCHMAVVCAVSDYPCGVDIEPLRKADLAVAERFLSNSICINLLQCEDKDEVFTRAWTTTESLLKSMPEKYLSQDQKVDAFGIPMDYTVSVFRQEDYYISLCAKNLPRNLELEPVRIEDLVM